MRHRLADALGAAAAPDAGLARRGSALEGLQAGIAAHLAVLDGAELTETGQSSAESSSCGGPGALLAPGQSAVIASGSMTGR